MCGRFTQRMSWAEIHALYQVPDQLPLNLEARYNGCPTQDFGVCRLDGTGRRTIAKLRWGLVPAWAKDSGIGSRLINARAESAHEKPAFRAAFKRRRCLVPANGWFEWRAEREGKQPYFVTDSNGEILSFGALWEAWAAAGATMESFTILTTEATPALADLHHRQPTIVRTEDFDEWLDPKTPMRRLTAMARNPHHGLFDRWRVSRRVNNPRNDAPELLQPFDEESLTGTE